jgi:hypothetical protein
MPKSIYFTDEAYQQITEAARLCGFRVSRGRGSQIALFVVVAANKACSGRVVLAPSPALSNPEKLSARRAVSKPTTRR